MIEGQAKAFEKKAITPMIAEKIEKTIVFAPENNDVKNEETIDIESFNFKRQRSIKRKKCSRII